MCSKLFTTNEIPISLSHSLIAYAPVWLRDRALLCLIAGVLACAKPSLSIACASIACGRGFDEAHAEVPIEAFVHACVCGLCAWER